MEPSDSVSLGEFKLLLGEKTLENFVLKRELEKALSAIRELEKLLVNTVPKETPNAG